MTTIKEILPQGMEFLEGALSNPGYDYRNFEKDLSEVGQYQKTRMERYEVRPERIVNVRSDWGPWTEQEWEPAEYDQQSVTYECSLSLGDLPVNGGTAKIIQALIDCASLKDKIESNRGKFNSLKAAANLDNPETLSAYTDFLKEKDVKPEDFDNFEAKTRDQVIQETGAALLSSKADVLSDQISSLVLVRETQKFFGVSLLEGDKAQTLHDAVKSSIRQTLKGEADVPEDDSFLQAAFKAPLEEVDKIRQAGRSAQKILGIGEAEAKEKISECIERDVPEIYSQIISNVGLGAAPA